MSRTMFSFAVALLALATQAQGWWMLVLLLAVMVTIFGSIPFTEAMIARYVDDRIRSRVAGARLTVSIGISSLAVWLLGPVVKASSFGTLLWMMTAIAACTVAHTSARIGEARSTLESGVVSFANAAAEAAGAKVGRSLAGWLQPAAVERLRGNKG